MPSIIVKMDLTNDVQQCRELATEEEKLQCLQQIKDRIIRVKDLVSKFSQEEEPSEEAPPEQQHMCPMMQHMLKTGDEEIQEGEEGEGEIPPEFEQRIRDFVASNDNLDDDEFHKYVQSMGIDPHEAEEVVYKQVRDLANNESIESLQEQYHHPRAFYAMAIQLHKKLKSWDKVKEQLLSQYHVQGSPKKIRFINHVVDVAQKLSSRPRRKKRA